MTEQHETLGSPDPSRGGPEVETAVDNAEDGSQAEGVHTPARAGESGDSRLEQMREVDVRSDGGDESSRSATQEPRQGPSPADIGSGGAQRLEGARSSDRAAGGEPVPDGPPFDTAQQDNSDA
jgi:hypothetical protein